MRIISFCLYGDNPLYLRGAVVNAHSAGQWYPDWSCWFYVGASVPRDIREQLEGAGARVISVEAPETPSAMLWRLRPALEQDVRAIMARDCDSRFGKREVGAVTEWLEGGEPFHIMRDHPEHRAPILGGMWGAIGPGLDIVRNALAQDVPADEPGVDQLFLTQHVYPAVRKSACIHDAYFCYEWHSRPFPSPREGCAFVGETINENEEPKPAHRETVRQADASFWRRLRIKAGSLKAMLLKRGWWRGLKG
jgi:hypothetical protein